MATLALHRRRAWGINAIAIFSLLFIAVCASAQSFNSSSEPKIPDTKRLYLKVNPLSALVGPIPLTSEYGLRFEMVVNHRLTYQVGAGYLGKSLVLQSSLVPDSIKSIWNEYQFPGVRLQGEMRYYFVKAKMDKNLSDYLSPSGLYIALHASYAAATFSAKGFNLPREDWTNFSVSAMLGLQLLHKESIGIDGYFGLGYKRNTATFTDFRSRTTTTNIKEIYGDGLGDFLTSPIKINLGCNLTFGLL